MKTVPIPARILAYGEVVVTVADGIAHRPHGFQRQIRTRQKWSGVENCMVDEPVFAFGYAPACSTVQSYDIDGTAPIVWAMSAGWAHRMGHLGCATCWKEEN